MNLAVGRALNADGMRRLARPGVARASGVRRAATSALFGLALVSGHASARGGGPRLHEPIAPDPREDLAMHVMLDADLPAAIATPGGAVAAPDPRRPPAATDATYAERPEHEAFAPDRDTRRPADVLGYDEPFTPSTAPFKRVSAFDAVAADEHLYVRDERGTRLPLSGRPPQPDEEAFYADLVVEIMPRARVRIPSVAPGARIVTARLGTGATSLEFRVFHDGADNWSVTAPAISHTTRARLVMELAAPRSAFGGDPANPAWGDLPLVAPLPDNVAREARQVRNLVGVDRGMHPREALARLVDYFRGFADSDSPPGGHGSVYLDLAASRKGVCRHRAFAFLITAQSLGIPTRFVENEAHAWVEVHDGAGWRRLDLGGAGHFAQPEEGAWQGPTQRPPPDPYGWPGGGRQGLDMVAEARARAVAASERADRGGAAVGGVSPGASSAPSASAFGASGNPATSESDPSSESTTARVTVSVEVLDPGHVVGPPQTRLSEAYRGRSLHLRGEARREGAPCAFAPVEVSLVDASEGTSVLLGSLATDGEGVFAGTAVVPMGVHVGDYGVIAKAPVSTCGGATH